MTKADEVNAYLEQEVDEAIALRVSSHMFLKYIRLHNRKMCPHSALRLQMPCFEHMVQMQSRRDQVRNGVFSPASPCPRDLVFDVLCGDMGLPSNA